MTCFCVVTPLTWAVSCPLKSGQKGLQAISCILRCVKSGASACRYSAGGSQKVSPKEPGHTSLLQCVDGSPQRKATLWSRTTDSQKAKAKTPRSQIL